MSGSFFKKATSILSCASCSSCELLCVVQIFDGEDLGAAVGKVGRLEGCISSCIEELVEELVILVIIVVVVVVDGFGIQLVDLFFLDGELVELEDSKLSSCEVVGLLVELEDVVESIGCSEELEEGRLVELDRGHDLDLTVLDDGKVMVKIVVIFGVGCSSPRLLLLPSRSSSSGGLLGDGDE